MVPAYTKALLNDLHLPYVGGIADTAGAALSRDHRAAANADPIPARLTNVRAAWKGNAIFGAARYASRELSAAAIWCNGGPDGNDAIR